MNPREDRETTSTAPRNGGHRDLFARISVWTTRITGGRWGFLTALGAVLLWAVMGPVFHYSEAWQLVINTGTTIVTFLMVFLIQNTQNRESKALHLKLDELIMSVNRARNELIDIEELPDDQLEVLSKRYHQVAAQCQDKLTEHSSPDDCRVPSSGKGADVPRKNHKARTSRRRNR